MSTFNNININNNKIEDNNNNNNSLYNNSIIDQLDTLVYKIDQCNPEIKKIVWDEYYRLSFEKTFNENQQTQINNQFFINQNNTNNFTPYLNQLLNTDNINYHSLELLYKAFTNSIKNNKNLLNKPESLNNNNQQNDMSISSNIFFTSSLWGFSYPAALQQLTLICYWLPVIKKLSKQQKKKLWQTCLMFPLFQKQQQPFENPGYFKTPDYQNIISKWFEHPIENLNSITIFFSAIGYLVELNLFKNDYYYPQSNVQVFSSSYNNLQCEQQQPQQQTNKNTLSSSTNSSPNKLSNSTSSFSSCSSDEEYEDETEEDEIKSAKKLKKSHNNNNIKNVNNNTNNTNNNNNNNNNVNNTNNSNNSSSIDSPLIYDGVPSLSPMSSPKTRLRSFSSTSISSSNSSPLMVYGSLHVDHPSYYDEIEINNNNNYKQKNNNNKKSNNNNNNNSNQININISNNNNNSVQSINSLIDTYINKKENESSSLLSCLTKKNLVNKSAPGSLLPTRSSSWSSYSTTPIGISNKSSTTPSLPSLLPSLPITSPLKSTTTILKSSNDNNNNVSENSFSLLDALAMTATAFSEIKNEKSNSPIAPIPRLPDMDCEIISDAEYELSVDNHETVPAQNNKKRILNGSYKNTSICI